MCAGCVPDKTPHPARVNGLILLGFLESVPDVSDKLRLLRESAEKDGSEVMH
jgi:hypothetical protein